MATRIDLHNKLVAALGNNHVYYQPPESVKMVYPCIVYSLGNEKVKYSDGSLYKGHLSYTVTVIDKDPVSTIPERVRAIPYCSFDRSYVTENLNHFVFKIFN